MPYGNASEVVNEHFESLLSRYQIGFGTSMKDSDFFSNQFNFSIKLSQDKICNIGSYIDSPDWKKKSNNKSKK